MYKISRNPGNYTIFAVTDHNRGMVWAGAVGLQLPVHAGMVQYSEEQQCPSQLQLDPVLVKFFTGFPQGTSMFHEI